MSAAAVLLEIAVKTSIVLALAWVATSLMARRSAAAVRHVVWTLALIAALGMPVLVLAGPAWRVAALPDGWGPGGRTVVIGSTSGRRADADVWPVAPSDGTHAPMVAEPGRRPDGLSGQRPLLSSATAWGPSGPVLPVLVVRAWALGVVIALVSLVVGLTGAAWLTRRAAPLLAPEWSVLQADVMARLGVTARVRLLMSAHVGVPVACGILRPTLVLPVDASSWDRDRRTVVLLHELSHVKRHDCLVQAVAHLAWAMHWYNPLAFVAISRLRAEQERACDDLVLRAGTPAADYAGHLCDIASTARRVLVPLWSTLAIARRSRLEARVTAILDDTNSRRVPSWRICAVMAGVVCLGVVPLGALRTVVAAQALAILPSTALTAVPPYASLIPALHPGSLNADVTDAATAFAPAAVVAMLPRVRPPVQEPTAESGRTFLAGCLVCHNRTMRTANLALDELDLERVGDHPEIWEKVVRRLRTGLHPPAGLPRSGRAAAEAFSGSIEAALDRADEANWMPGVAEQLSDREIAARLAKFLWNSDPDNTLVALAASGKLRDPSILQQQVKRLIADRRSAALLTGFFGDWLFLKNMATIKPDPALFPEFDDNLREAFRRETELFLASQVREDHSLTDLLAANYTFLNERLADHYGIGKISGSQFRRVRLANDTRGGLLGHGSMLSVTSYATRTSPVLRGKWLLETWLGVPPPPPPPNVPALTRSDPDHPASMRMRMEQHRRNPVCAACHTSMDPLGFALENFDAIGRWRTSDGGLPIDASGTLADGSRFDGPAQLRSVLLDRREAIVNTIILKLLAYALGRPARHSDMPAVRAIAWDGAPSNFTWSSTIVGIVKSAPFQMKRID